MRAVAFDLAEITGSSEVVIDGHPLRVCPGMTCGGRYWQLSTLDGIPVGMVAEHTAACGRELTVCGANGAWAADLVAAHLVVAS